MAKAHFCIGIDLGTSNCALAYRELDRPDAQTVVQSIFQYDDWEVIGQSVVLPSFLYFPTEEELQEEKTDKSKSGLKRSHVVGNFARKQASLLPGRVVNSAKSWLCHAGVDREAKILPWGSEDMAAGDKLSPVEVSAALLNYLRYVWDESVAKGNKAWLFDRQEIVITVPASFDNIAQKLTRDAAHMAGYPAGVRLLEEPQAAFYAWLEKQEQAGGLLKAMPSLAENAQTVLVCDIGGETFQHTRVEPNPAKQNLEKSSPHIEMTVSRTLPHRGERALINGQAPINAPGTAYLLAS